jgi:hypothetical protein
MAKPVELRHMDNVPPPAPATRPKSLGDTEGEGAWTRTAITLILLVGMNLVGAFGGHTWFVVLLGAGTVLYAIFGLLPMAARAIDAKSGIGHACISLIVAVLVIPATASGFMFVSAEVEADALREEIDSYVDTSDMDYEECMDDPDTTLEQCEALE